VPNRLSRTRLAEQIVGALRAEHGRKVLPGIRQSVSVAEAALERRPLILTHPRAPVTDDFRALARALASSVPKYQITE
jgi:cellulose biosynthesis protein BcsQ